MTSRHSVVCVFYHQRLSKLKLETFKDVCELICYLLISLCSLFVFGMLVMNVADVFLPRDARSITLIFRHQGSLRKSDGFTPNGGAKYKRGSDFRPKHGYDVGNGNR